MFKFDFVRRTVSVIKYSLAHSSYYLYLNKAAKCRMLCAAALVMSAHAQATLLASDSMACTGATMLGQGGGLGWAGTWTGNPFRSGVFTPGPTSLIGLSAPSTQGGVMRYNGSGLSNGARIFRALDVDVGSVAASLQLSESHTTYFGNQQYAYGKPGTTIWFAYLIDAGTAGSGVGNGSDLAQVHLFDDLDQTQLTQDDNNKGGEVLATGRGAGNPGWFFERTCAHSPCGGNTSSINVTTFDPNTNQAVPFSSRVYWAVFRFDFNSASTTSGTAMTFWLDPVPGTMAPDVATAITLSGNGQTHVKTVNLPAMHFNWVEFGGQIRQFGLDEVRVADSYADLSAGSWSAPGCDDIFANDFE
jgi:hypothetical protein